MIEEKTTITIVAAQPGWYVATFGEGEFHLEPILAWEIERKERPYHPSAKRPGELCIIRGVLPITLEDSDFENSGCCTIKRPDGVFEIPYDITFDDEAAAIEHFQNKAKLRETDRVKA